MQITIIAVGKLKEKYLKMAVDEYLKRLTTMAKVNILEVPDEKIPTSPSANQIKQLLELEGKKINSVIPSNSYLIVLDLEGENLASEELAARIEDLALKGQSHLTFVIGGSHGLSEEVLKKADFSLSFGKMTFPHQLMRPILLEQIYRSFSINQGRAYHK